MIEIRDEVITKKIRIAGLFILLGLVVEGLSLMWNHPLSFVAFLGIGGLLLGVGVVVYLVMLLVAGQKPE
jgi:hypothetical protein